jgi:hypothetical protein
MIPEFIGYVKVNQTIEVRSPCFQKTKISATQKEVTIFTSNPTSKTCSDGYLIATLDDVKIHYTFFKGSHVIKMNNPSKIKEVNIDFQKLGFRIFRFKDGPLKTIRDLWQTIDLFLGALIGKSVPGFTAKDNLRFMEEKMGYVMAPRKITDVKIPKSYVNSGDFLGIMRLDGIDPMLAYGMGSQTGHTAIAIWDQKELYVFESTVKSNYWPDNGIQRHSWDEWIALAKKADYNVVHLPLGEFVRKRFNATAALEFWKQTKGLYYGYPNMLMGWIDTPSDNMPPPLSMEFIQIFIPLVVEKFKLKSSIDPLTQTLNKRLGTTNLTTWQCYVEAYSRGLSFADIMIMPELDKWNYNFGERSGPSMVCDVFVGRMWKAGGLFGGLDVNVAEFTNIDAYSTNFFDLTQPRPDQCNQADPYLPYCQLLGKYRITLKYPGRFIPFNRMREHCPGLPPNYDKDWLRC